jgi:hypothetical protein
MIGVCLIRKHRNMDALRLREILIKCTSRITITITEMFLSARNVSRTATDI